MAQDVLDPQQKDGQEQTAHNPSPLEVDEVLKKIELDTTREELRKVGMRSASASTISTAVHTDNGTKAQIAALNKNTEQLDVFMKSSAGVRLPNIAQRGFAPAVSTASVAEENKNIPADERSGNKPEDKLDGQEDSQNPNGPTDPAPRSQKNVPLPPIGRPLHSNSLDDKIVPPQPALPINSAAVPKPAEAKPEQEPEVPHPQIIIPEKKKKKRELPKGAEEVVGKVSSEWWWYGFGLASAVFFTGADFMIGALVMDAYWVAHARKPDFFPFKKWQKFVTVFANIAPVLYVIAFVLLTIAIACNLPQYKYLISAVEITQGKTPGLCSSFDLSKTGIGVSAVGTSPAAGGSGGPGGHVGSGTCSWTDSGPAGVTNLSQTCFGQNAQAASAIAVAESGNDATKGSRVDICTGDGSVASWGLFQINITNHKIGGLDCPSVFTHQYTGSNKDCAVKPGMQSLYQQCVAAAQDPALNIQAACVISSNGTNWNAWGANKVCKIN